MLIIIHIYEIKNIIIMIKILNTTPSRENFECNHLSTIKSLCDILIPYKQFIRFVTRSSTSFTSPLCNKNVLMYLEGVIAVVGLVFLTCEHVVTVVLG